MFKQRRCVSCGARDWSPCAECIDKFKPAPSLSIDGARTTSAIAVFEGPARDVIHAFKYHNARSLAKWFAPALVAGLAADIDLVTWAPTTKRRRRHRGYDQAELLARAVGRLTELRCQATIRRLDDHSAQNSNAARLTTEAARVCGDRSHRFPLCRAHRRCLDNWHHYRLSGAMSSIIGGGCRRCSGPGQNTSTKRRSSVVSAAPIRTRIKDTTE